MWRMGARTVRHALLGLACVALGASCGDGAAPVDAPGIDNGPVELARASDENPEPSVFELTLVYDSVLETLFTYMWYANSAVNFYLYVLTGARFRRETKALFRCYSDTTARQGKRDDC